METVLTFLISLLVSLLCIPFAAFQRNRLAAALETLISDSLKGVSDPAPTRAAKVTHTERIVDSTQLKSTLSQTLDAAYAFPSVVLTITAYIGLVGSGAFAAAILVIVAVTAVVCCIWLGDPSNLSWYLRLRTGKRGNGSFGLSVLTSLLVIANAIGLGFAVAMIARPGYS